MGTSVMTTVQLAPSVVVGRWAIPWRPCTDLANDPGCGCFGQLDAEIRAFKTRCAIYGTARLLRSGGQLPQILLVLKKKAEWRRFQPPRAV